MHYTKVDRESCIACGLCQIYAPTLFEYDEEGIAYAKKDKNKGQEALCPEEIDSFKIAYQNCPTGAILRSNQPFSLEDLTNQ